MSNSLFGERNRHHLNQITNKYTQKDQTEPFRKAPENFTCEIHLGAVVPGLTQLSYTREFPCPRKRAEKQAANYIARGIHLIQ